MKCTWQKDVIIKSDELDTLLLEKQGNYIYLRMRGIYWGLTVMNLLGQLHCMNREEILTFIKSCQHERGGISANIGHDPHLLYTLIVEYVRCLQKEDGSFAGDTWGETDTRFSFCGMVTLALLGKLDATNVEKAIEFVLSCMNFDGGFGFLSITSQLHQVNSDLLRWWFCEQQLPSEVCYSWWVLTFLKIIERLHWIDREKLCSFILACQDEETGGFADRPGDMIKPVSPVFCMPEVLWRVNVQPELVN
ncbi:hypothetical protein FD754_009411 [Muntiacus muntjak]|uniref:Geranylgeranyl transferase type-2 subunit beta n=1 Tax=Muntiacus muntjak TaxID=9888 RepID=A0A5N3WWX3_MUNMU|nr:hypothetical protein FD754_009411 [Muntiacus muntjak]